jgi:hypothetical protein
MQKGRAFLWMGVSVNVVALAVIACSDDSSSEFQETSADAGGSQDAGTGFIVDSSSAADGAASASCNPALPDGFAPTWNPPKKSAACSAAQLGEYYEACLTTHAADAGDPCKTWTDANASCAQCVEPADGSGPIQWHRDRYYFTLNVAGCLAIQRSELGAGQCPAAYSAAIECERASCDGCFSAANATFGDFQVCQKAAKANTCTSYEGKVSDACGAGYSTPDGGTSYECFRQPGDANQKDHFVRVEGIFCGP